MLTLIRHLGVALAIGLFICLIPMPASAGIGVRGGIQVRGGTFGIMGVHLDTSLPFLRIRPNVEIGKRTNETIINPGLDVHLKLNPTGIGPLPYVGGGVGIQSTRISATLPGGSTSTRNKVSYNFLAGIDFPVAPFVKMFIEGKGITVEGKRTARILVGLTIH